MILLKSEQDLRMMAESGRILAAVMQKVVQSVKPGITTAALDRRAEELIEGQKVIPAFKGYRGYPGTLCASVNEEIIHGIPGERVLEVGDIVSLDLGINYNGYFSDMAVTVPVGKVSAERRKLLDVTRKSLYEGIRQFREGKRVSDISSAIQRYVEANGFSVVRQFVGHGIGKSLHEDPEVPNFGRPGRGELLQEGAVLAIEPMVNAGEWECQVLENGWTAVTVDGSSSAHFEHTVALTHDGAKILTQYS